MEDAGLRAIGERDEVLHRARCFVGEELDFELALVSKEGVGFVGNRIVAGGTGVSPWPYARE